MGHSPIHQLFLALAVGLILVSPGVAAGLGRYRLLGPAGSLVSLRRAALLPLTVLSGSAGLIHVSVVGAHAREDLVIGLGLLIAGLFQLGWAFTFFRQPGRALAAAAVVANAAFLGLWVLSRTAGLPFGAHPGMPEAMGIPDVFVAAFELLIVVGAAAFAASRWRAVMERPRLDVAGADLALVLVLIVLGLSATYALAEVSLHGGHP